MGQDDKEWDQRYMDQLGSTINYGLGLSTASIGFCATQISQPNGTFLPTSYRAAVLWLGASVMCGIGCSLFRLSIFLMRRTSDGDGFLINCARHLVSVLFVLQIVLYGGGVWRIGTTLLG